MRAPKEDEAAPRRARADTGDERPRQIADRIYTDAFLADLQQQFGFEATRPETAALLRRIAARYILGRRWENQVNLLKSDHRKYIALKEATERYLALVKQYEEDEMVVSRRVV